MTKYNRDFLIPYLRNLCSLYFVDRKLSSYIAAKKRAMSGYKPTEFVRKPEEPEYLEESYGCSFYLGIVGVAIAVLMVIGAFVVKINSYTIVTIICCIVYGGPGLTALLHGIDKARDIPRMNAMRNKEYAHAMEVYERRNKEIREDNWKKQERISEIEAEIEKFQRERTKVRNLIASVYSANVIPSRYRDFYTAVFLYDWFSTSGADDLDHALSMYVLEEIKSKLDEIIENQAEMILNQQMFIANQYKSLEEQREHNALMQRKAREIAASNEEQTKYLSMIECNTEATAYFAAATYFKS